MPSSKGGASHANNNKKRKFEEIERAASPEFHSKDQEIKALVQRLQEREEKIEDLKKQVGWALGMVDLGSQVTTQAKIIADLQEQADTQQKTISNFYEQLANQEKTISDLRELTANQESTNSAFRELTANQEKTNSVFREQVAELKAALEGGTTETKTPASVLEDQLAEVKTTLAIGQEEAKKYADSVSALEIQMTDMMEAVEESQDFGITQHEQAEKVQALKETVEEMAQEILDLRVQIEGNWKELGNTIRHFKA